MRRNWHSATSYSASHDNIRYTTATAATVKTGKHKANRSPLPRAQSPIPRGLNRCCIHTLLRIGTYCATQDEQSASSLKDTTTEPTSHMLHTWELPRGRAPGVDGLGGSGKQVVEGGPEHKGARGGVDLTRQGRVHTTIVTLPHSIQPKTERVFDFWSAHRVYYLGPIVGHRHNHGVQKLASTAAQYWQKSPPPPPPYQGHDGASYPPTSGGTHAHARSATDAPP